MNDPFIRILKINRKSIPDLRKYTDNVSIFSFFNSHPIPQFNIKEINNVENLLKNGENHSKAIKQYDNRLIPFITKPVQAILNLVDQNDTTALDYIDLYILHLYVSWIIFYDSSHETDDLSDLLILIIYLYNTEYKNIAKNCFFYAFNIYILAGTFTNFPVYLQALIAFFIKFTNIKDEDFNIFTLLLSNLKMYNLDNYVFLFMDEIEKVVHQYQARIPKDVYDALMSNSITFLINFKESSIKFYGLIISHISDDQAEEIISTLTLVICQYVINYSHPVSFPIGQESEAPIGGSFYIVKGFPTKSTFLNGINFRFKTLDTILPPLKSLQDPVIMEKLQPLFEAFKKSKFSSIEIVKKIGLFLNKYEKEEKLRNYILYNLYVIFISLIKIVLPQIIDSVSFVDLLYRKAIFNSSIYCFDPDSQPSEIVNINILRTEAFKYILYDDINRLTAFFDSFITSPTIFNEIVQRCIDNSHIIIAKIIESPCLIEFLSNSLIFYQNLRYQGEKNYDETSSKLFYLISIISQDKRAKESLFRDNFFCSAFLAQSYEVAPREFVFSQIKSASNSLTLPTAFLSMLRSVFHFFPSDESVILANGMLLLINDIIATNRSMIERYSIIAKPLFNTLSILKQSQPSTELLLSILLFFTEISYPISDDQYIRFSETIRKVYGNGNDEVIFKRLIQFIAGDCLSSVNPSFIIRRPHATLMLFYMYSTSIKVINYIIKLCLYDSENCVACHEGRLDFFVLETIRSIWDDESANKEYLESLFKLFEAISTSSCSLEIIEKFISLLSPINGKYLSPHYQFAIDTIFNIIRFETKIPLYQMPLKKELIIKPNEIISLTKKGFSFVGWMYVEPGLTGEYPIIFKLWNDKNWSITISLRSNVINFLEIGPTYNISSNMDSYLPKREWIRVVMTYYIENIGLFNLYVNGILISTIRTAMPDILDWNFHFSFGGCLLSINQSPTNDNKNAKKRYSILGPFAIYPKLSNEHILSVFNDNPNIFSPIENKPFFTCLPTKINIFEKESFYSLFVGRCYLYLILPIFSLSNVNFRNNERYKLLYENAVSILLEVLSVCKEVENMFFKVGGFRIISYLLSDANPSFLTYHLYTRFFTIFQSLKNENLQEDLFAHILTDFSIWYICEEQLLILKYIHRVVLPSSDHLSSKYFGFEVVLKNIFAFFSNQETHRIRPESVNLIQCRKILYTILFLNTPNHSDFQFLLGSTKNFNKDVRVKTELIELIDTFSEMHKDLFMKFMAREEISSLLLKLVQKSIDITPIPIITLLSNLHQRSIININDFTSHVLVKISPTTASVQLFENIIDLVNNNNIYQWFPLLCFVGMQLPWEDAKSIQTIPIKKVSLLNDWYFWPVIWALELTREGQVSLMNLLAKGDPMNWLPICALIEKSSLVKGQNPDEPTSCFLSQVCHYIIISEILLSKPISNYFQLIIGHHLFFRHTSKLNNNCYNIIADTYGEDDNMNDSNANLRHFSSFKKMCSSEIDQIISDSSGSNSYIEPERERENNTNQVHFGLRLDDDMDWLDFELAKTFLYIMSSYRTILDLDLYILTIYFFTKTSNNADISKYLRIANQLNPNDQQSTILSHKDSCDLTYFIESIFAKKFASLKVNFSANDENLFNLIRSKSVDTDFESELLKGSLLKSPSSSKLIKIDKEELNSNSQTNEFNEDELFQTINRRNKWKLWKKMLKDLTQEGKPWESLILCKEQLERDETLCSIGCPFKIIQKWKSAKQTAEIIANEIVYGVEPIDDLSCSTELNDHDQIEESCLTAICTIIKINAPDENTEISVYKSILYLKRKKPKIIHIWSIVSVIGITYNSRQTAIEITLGDGKSYFFVFQTTAIRNQVFEAINRSIHEFQKKNKMPFIYQTQRLVPSALTNGWKEHRISNFSYILMLNKMSGCSFNVESQYPIFPRILDDFNDIKSIRDYKVNYQYSEEPPLFYLQRLDPFDKISKRSFDNISQISTKFELTPEFFYLPEFLISEVQVQNVIFPKWANSPFDFVYKCRKILESEEVSMHLNKWIDLVWGSFRVLYCNYLPLFEYPHVQRKKLSDIPKKEPIFIERKMENKNNENKNLIKLNSHSIVICESKDWISYYQHELANLICLKKKSNQYLVIKIDFSFDLNQISTAFISEEFHTIAIGVDEGKTIFVHSLEHKLPVFLIKLDENNKADLIAISQSWGFIVVISSKSDTQNFVTLYNINGLFIKQVKIKSIINQIVCWTNRDGFDFMCLADVNGNIYVTEIYEISEELFDNPFYSCNCEVDKLMFDKSNETIIIQTVNRKEIIKSV